MMAQVSDYRKTVSRKTASSATPGLAQSVTVKATTAGSKPASAKGAGAGAQAQSRARRKAGASPVGAVSGVYSRMDRVAGGDAEDRASAHLSTFASGAQSAAKASAGAVKGGAKASKAAVGASKATVKGMKAAKAGVRTASEAARRAKALKKQGRLGKTVRKAGEKTIRSAVLKGKAGLKKAPKSMARNGARLTRAGAAKGVKFGAGKGLSGAYKGVAGGGGAVMSRTAGDDPAAQAAAQAADMLLKAPGGVVRGGRTVVRGAKGLGKAAKGAGKAAKAARNAPKAARATIRTAAKVAQVVRAVAAKVAAAVASMIAAAAPMMGIVAIVGVVVGLIMSIISWLPSFIGGREQDRWDSYCMCQAAQDGATPNRETWQTAKANADDVIGYRDSDVDDAAVLRKLKDDYNWPLTDPAACDEHDEPEDSKGLAAEWSAASGKYASQAQLIDADAAAVRESRQKKLGNDVRKRIGDKLADARQLLADSDGKTQGNEVRQVLTDRINEAQALVDSGSYDLDRLKAVESDLQGAMDDVNASMKERGEE